MTDLDILSPACRFVVAIPACNEESRIGACLAALAVQRDTTGAPLSPDMFAALVLANNCRDGTAAEVRRWAALVPFPVTLVERQLPPEQSNAGWARKTAMDAAADLLERTDRHDGAILTTDADSAVCSTWIAGTEAALAAGADAVAGYIEAEPAEVVELGPAFVRRGRLEDCYLACAAEIWALGDPRLHDPWPNHRVASGASFAVTLAAYRAIGGLPPRPLGEDVALADALASGGFRIRHPLDVTVTTSCRLDGRAPGGAAETMKLRRDEPDAACDADMEPAARLVRRAVWKGRLRRWHAGSRGSCPDWAARLGLAADALRVLAQSQDGFEPFWQAVERESPRLRRGSPLRPSQLPREIRQAKAAIRHLRGPGSSLSGSPGLDQASARRP